MHDAGRNHTPDDSPEAEAGAPQRIHLFPPVDQAHDQGEVCQVGRQQGLSAGIEKSAPAMDWQVQTAATFLADFCPRHHQEFGKEV